MLKKIYLKYREVIDYLFWGGVAFCLYMVLAWVFTAIVGWSDLFTTIVDNVICIIFAFFTNKLFVFRSKTGSIRAFCKEFVNFCIARGFTFALNALIIFVGCNLMGFNKDSYHMPFISDGMIVQLIAQVIVIVSNYIFSKLWIFRKQKDSKEVKAGTGEASEEKENN